MIDHKTAKMVSCLEEHDILINDLQNRIEAMSISSSLHGDEKTIVAGHFALDSENGPHDSDWSLLTEFGTMWMRKKMVRAIGFDLWTLSLGRDDWPSSQFNIMGAVMAFSQDGGFMRFEVWKNRRQLERGGSVRIDPISAILNPMKNPMDLIVIDGLLEKTLPDLWLPFGPLGHGLEE